MVQSENILKVENLYVSYDNVNICEKHAALI